MKFRTIALGLAAALALACAPTAYAETGHHSGSTAFKQANNTGQYDEKQITSQATSINVAGVQDMQVNKTVQPSALTIASVDTKQPVDVPMQVDPASSGYDSMQAQPAILVVLAAPSSTPNGSMVLNC